jgi:hypothetical protein
MKALAGSEAVKLGGSWVVRPKKFGWVFEKSFPTKWKAELALEVWRKGGRVSDYWQAARELQRSRRTSRTVRAIPPEEDEAVSPGAVHPNATPQVEGENEALFETLVLGTRSCLLMWLYIFGPPVLLMGLVFVLLVWLPIVGKPVVAMLGGAFVAVLAGSGSRGAHPTWSGGWRYNMWGRRRSAVGSLLAFIGGAVFTWLMLF